MTSLRKLGYNEVLVRKTAMPKTASNGIKSGIQREHISLIRMNLVLKCVCYFSKNILDVHKCHADKKRHKTFF